MDHVWQVWGTIWSLELPPTIHPKHSPYKKRRRSLKCGTHHLPFTVIITKNWWLSTHIFVTFWLGAPHLYLVICHTTWYEFTTTRLMMIIFTFGVLNGFNCMASILDMTFIYSQRLPNKMASPHNNYDNNGIPTPCPIPAALSTCHHIQEHCNIYPIHKTNAQLSCKYNTPIHTVF